MQYNELYHHGVLGMKWGQHIFGKVKGIGRKKSRTKDEPEKTETPEEKKNRIRRSGTVKELIENSDMLSDKELADAVNRMRNKRQLTEWRNSDIESKIKKVQSRMTLMRNVVEEGGKLYNQVATVLNTYGGTDLPTNKKSTLPVSINSLPSVNANLDQLSDEEIQRAAVRINNQNTVANFQNNRRSNSSN